MVLRRGTEISFFFCFRSTEMSIQIIKNWGNTSLGGPRTLNLMAGEEAKESNEDLLLTWQVHGWEGRGRVTQLPCFTPAEGQCGADSAFFQYAGFFSWNGRGFHCDWTGLIFEVNAYLFQEVSSHNAASWTHRIMRVWPHPNIVSWAKVNTSVCPGSFPKARRVLHKSVQSQPAQMRTSCSQPVLPTQLQLQPLLQTRVLGQREGWQLISGEDTQNRAERNTPRPPNDLVPFDQLLKI